MKVLGIDPGFDRVGWGVVEWDGSKTSYHGCGCITTPRSMEHKDRLARVAHELGEIVRASSPDIVHIEKLFFSKNKKTALGVAEARGVILATLATYNIPVVEFSPAEVKVGVTGNGRAEKRQVAWMVKKILSAADSVTSDDALDALALCLIRR